MKKFIIALAVAVAFSLIHLGIRAWNAHALNGSYVGDGLNLLMEEPNNDPYYRGNALQGGGPNQLGEGAGAYTPAPTV